jgi:hypothetical protein
MPEFLWLGWLIVLGLKGHIKMAKRKKRIKTVRRKNIRGGKNTDLGIVNDHLHYT